MVNKLFIVVFCLVSFCVFGQVSPAASPVKEEPKVEVKADFPTGINTFRSQLMEGLNFKKIDGYGEIEVSVTFTIDETGKLSNIVTVGDNDSFNKEVKRVIAGVNQKWIPGTINGEVVKTNYSMTFKVSIYD